LPFLLRGLELPPEPSSQEAEDRARITAAQAAIQGIQRAQQELGAGRPDADLYNEAGVRIMELYRQRIEGRSQTGAEAALTRQRDEIERQLRLAGLRAERDELYRLARNHATDDEMIRKLVREVDLLEARFGTS
jgi:CPA1 family monovalent cation:H+ antiporter